MKRQLNFWSKPNSAPEKDLVNVSLSIEDNQFSVIFRKPGSAIPIRQTVIQVNDDESFDLRRAFELAGAAVFHDEMDERIYFANIARQRDTARQAEYLGVSVGWSVLLYIACMLIFALLLKIYVITSLCFSLSISIIFCIFFRRYKVSKEKNNETKTPNSSESS